MKLTEGKGVNCGQSRERSRAQTVKMNTTKEWGLQGYLLSHYLHNAFDIHHCRTAVCLFI